MVNKEKLRKNIIYVVTEPDADPYCGKWVIGVFSSKEKAENYIKTLKYQSALEIEEWELDSIEGRKD